MRESISSSRNEVQDESGAEERAQQAEEQVLRGSLLHADDVVKDNGQIDEEEGGQRAEVHEFDSRIQTDEESGQGDNALARMILNTGVRNLG